MPSRILAISAHPDDETIGAGGTLIRHRLDGDEIFWCVVTRAHTPAWSEEDVARASAQVDQVKTAMGFKEVFRCGFPTVKLNTLPTIEITTAIQRVVDELRPHIVYAPSAHDINEDHRVVHAATLVATRPLPNSSVDRVLAYEIAPTAGYGGYHFEPTVFVDISATLEEKISIMRRYETELREFPHPRSVEGIRLFAQERGLRVGVGAAECFELIREIRR
jgi:LmbE family N-acetylglucosaminyl deacetylase